MFKQLIVLGLLSGNIYKVDIPDGRVETFYDKAGRVSFQRTAALTR